MRLPIIRSLGVSGCGAVGSASGLGPEGRTFESCHPDKKEAAQKAAAHDKNPGSFSHGFRGSLRPVIFGQKCRYPLAASQGVPAKTALFDGTLIIKNINTFFYSIAKLKLVSYLAPYETLLSLVLQGLASRPYLFKHTGVHSRHEPHSCLPASLSDKWQRYYHHRILPVEQSFSFCFIRNGK